MAAVLTDRLRRVGYGWLVVQGLLAAIAPERSIDVKFKLWGAGVENVGALEPKDWYVRSVRAAGVGMIAAGITGLLFERNAGVEEDDAGREQD
ncbi:hypothetical protein ACFR9U_07440 [Halorientalis brevis]|uniref:DUF6199 domain-containing protein n=1 Tax=Halorientalis brevis TaxID=1126241 RepID=A0ABD6C8Y5_9EURY|nr:hypothetical protein [Halorientalis brevis]